MTIQINKDHIGKIEKIKNNKYLPDNYWVQIFEKVAGQYRAFRGKEAWSREVTEDYFGIKLS